ncbi:MULTISPECIES: magnesium chelatase domain-containing protein [Nocardia]|uniref:magnesium chelatase domain-containing protein n=1 Tax=Nocardia TaxID=1817 RepID=UPI0002D8D80D|nr:MULTISPECIES: magnesium chelatase domain-containing protein [Nocardia]
MIEHFAWTAHPTRDGDTELALLAASPTTEVDTVAAVLAAHPVVREPRNRIRAALANSDAAYPSDPYRLYRLGGAGHHTQHDLAAALTVHQLATDPLWGGLLDRIVFLAELGLDGSLRPRLPAHAIAAVAAVAARAEFRYAVTAPPTDSTGLGPVDGITVVSPTDLRGVLDWLDSLTSDPPAPTTASPAVTVGGDADPDGLSSDAEDR